MQRLERLFAIWAGEPCVQCRELGANGSNRRYYRLLNGESTLSAIGCINDDVRENEAFYAYSRHFPKGVLIPGEIEAVKTAAALKEGIDLSEATLQDFRDMAEEYGVEYTF